MLSLAAVLIVLNGFVFPWITRRLLAISGQTMLDLRLFYTPQTALDAAKAFTPAGRQLYVVSALTADLVYPLAYASLLALLLRLMLRRALPAESAAQTLAGLPFAAMGADLLENLSISGLLLFTPGERVFAVIASMATSLKWLLIAACAGALLISGMLYLQKRRQHA